MGNMSLQILLACVYQNMYGKIYYSKKLVCIHRGDARIRIRVKIYSMAEHRFQMTQQRQRQFRKNSWKLRIEELEVHRIVHFDRALLVRIIIRQMRRDRSTIRVYPRIRGVAISHGFSRSEISTGNWPALINATRQNPRNYESSLQSLYESIDYASIIARLLYD